jgi:hypothetical protein
VVAPVTLPVEVSTLLKLAAETQKSVYDSLRKAAAICAPFMSAHLSANDKVKQIMAMCATTLNEINDDNVRSTFASCLFPYAAPTTLVEIPAPTPNADGSKGVLVVPAIQAVTASKTVATNVAKQIRDAEGVGRAAGAGRPATVAAPVVPVAAPVVQPLGDKIAATWFDELDARIKNPGDCAKIVAALDRAGYSVTRKTSVAPAPSTTTADATAALAAALVDTVPATAIALAAAKAADKAKTAKGGTAK